MGSVEVLNVNPDVLRQAADGINGVIAGISGGAFGSYQGQLGRGFDDLTLTGRQMSHPDAKSGFDNFVGRWEWGTRALIAKANDIGQALDLGAGMFELQEQYFANAGKDMLNDLAGDPSLPKESIRDADNNIIVRGTDDMSLGEMVEYNKNRLLNPDWSAQSFTDAMPTITENWQSIQDDAAQAGRNVVIPGEAARVTVDGFFGDEPASVPSGPVGVPAPAPAH